MAHLSAEIKIWLTVIAVMAANIGYMIGSDIAI